MLRLADPPIVLGAPLASAQFEYTNREALGETGPQQPTSVDVYLKSVAGERVLVEFKFTETEFGTCSVYESGDCDGANFRLDFSTCYLHEYAGRQYMKLMEKYHLLPESEACPFVEFYQAYRLLLLALEEEAATPGKPRAQGLLVHDGRNPAFLHRTGGVDRGRYVRFKRLLPKEMANRVSILRIQDMANALEKSGRAEWIADFRSRYAIGCD